MKMTLLEIVQDILNDLDSDLVNSIDDTSESQQVAQIVKSTYFAIISDRKWPHTRRLIQVTPSGNSSLPTFMYLQDNIQEMSSVYYDKAKASDGDRRRFEEIKYLEPDDFLRLCNHRDNTQSNYLTVTDPNTSIVLTIRNDVAPTYYTSFDDNTLTFDSYDSSVDDTLQQHKTQAYAYVTPDWVQTDDAVPDLPEKAFTFLLEEAKSRASFKIRQQPDQKAEQESQRQRKWLARTDRRVKQGIRFPNYGRFPRQLSYQPYRDPTFRNEN
jgi:hypothetical protein